MNMTTNIVTRCPSEVNEKSRKILYMLSNAVRLEERMAAFVLRSMKVPAEVLNQIGFDRFIPGTKCATIKDVANFIGISKGSLFSVMHEYGFTRDSLPKSEYFEYREFRSKIRKAATASGATVHSDKTIDIICKPSNGCQKFELHSHVGVLSSRMILVMILLSRKKDSPAKAEAINAIKLLAVDGLFPEVTIEAESTVIEDSTSNAILAPETPVVAGSLEPEFNTSSEQMCDPESSDEPVVATASVSATTGDGSVIINMTAEMMTLLIRTAITESVNAVWDKFEKMYRAEK